MTCFHMREKEHYLSLQTFILLLIKSVGNLSLVSKRIQSYTINLKLSFQGVRVFKLLPFSRNLQNGTSFFATSKKKKKQTQNSLVLSSHCTSQKHCFLKGIPLPMKNCNAF